MKTKFGFTLYTLSEFEAYLKNLKVGRTVLYIQQHHTFMPSYQHFTGNNHFDLQKGMKDYHVGTNGFVDIAQHYTIFPDGTIMTGRSMELAPAGIKGFNSGAICIENLGNFDLGKDAMKPEQKNAIIKATALLANKFSIPVNTDKIVYHHWFNLSTGERNNGTKNNKTCPGTNFFGGNSVTDCQNHFLPLVIGEINNLVVPQPSNPVMEYRIVTADSLNVRIAPNSDAAKAPGRDPIGLATVIRVYEINNGWCRISSSAQHWVSGRFTEKVMRAVVNTDALNVRSGAGTNFDKVGNLTKATEVFVSEIDGDWSKIGLEMKWVKSTYLDWV